MSKPLSEILSEALAIVEKAAPGELSVYDANEGDGWPPRPLWCFKNEAYDSEDEEAEVLQGSVHYGGKEDAEAIAAAINFLRQHGHALAALARRVERIDKQHATSIPTPEQIKRHAIKAGECPPQCRVMLVSSIERLQRRDAQPNTVQDNAEDLLHGPRLPSGGSIESKAKAWDDVLHLMDELSPEWPRLSMVGSVAVRRAIRAMSAPPSTEGGEG